MPARIPPCLPTKAHAHRFSLTHTHTLPATYHTSSPSHKHNLHSHRHTLTHTQYTPIQNSLSHSLTCTLTMHSLGPRPHTHRVVKSCLTHLRNGFLSLPLTNHAQALTAFYLSHGKSLEVHLRPRCQPRSPPRPTCPWLSSNLHETQF